MRWLAGSTKLISSGKRTCSFSVLCAVVLSGSGCANLPQESRAVESIEFRTEQADATAPITIPERSVYVFFDHSPKATEELGRVLRKKGYVVHDKIESADAAFKVSGSFRVYGKARQGVSGNLGDFLEQALPVDGSALGEQKTPYETHLLASGFADSFTPSLAKGMIVEDVLMIVGNVTGFNGWLNETLLGDPRGICFKKGCGEYISEATVRFEDLNGGRAWTVIGEGKNSKDIVLQAVVEQTIAVALKPFAEQADGDVTEQTP